MVFVCNKPPGKVGAPHDLTASEVFSVDSTEYINDFEFKNGSLSMCKFDGGYLAVPFVPSTYRYYITDHLGNNSLVVYGSGSVQQATHYYPFGSIHHSSTSQGYQKYKYNGKEYDSMHGLNEYDYGARQYDPAIGMFTSMDPLCEKYYHISPYAYCGGNPVRYVDPDGKSVKIHYITPNGKSGVFVFRDTGQKVIRFPRSKNNFVRNVLKAYIYNRNNYLKHFHSGKTGLIKLVQSADAKVNVVQTTNGDNYYNQSKIYQGRIDGFILGWDPNSASKYETGVRVSPATILAHEGDHAYDQSKSIESCQSHVKRTNIKDNQYDNAEEKRVITGDEQRQAEANGEIAPGQQTRYNHKGTYYKIDDPLKR